MPKVDPTPEDGPKIDRGIVAESRWGELLATAQRGDSEAYRLFLFSITPFVRGVAHKGTWSDEMATALVHDVLLTVHRLRHTYQPGRPVKPWLATIVARRSIDAIRRRG
jgi:RNA polymerase sigma-70 factor (ECF subfamily)